MAVSFADALIGFPQQRMAACFRAVVPSRPQLGRHDTGFVYVVMFVNLP